MALIRSRTRWINTTQSGNTINTHELASNIDTAVTALTKGLIPDDIVDIKIAVAGHGFSALVTVIDLVESGAENTAIPLTTPNASAKTSGRATQRRNSEPYVFGTIPNLNENDVRRRERIRKLEASSQYEDTHELERLLEIDRRRSR